MTIINLLKKCFKIIKENYTYFFIDDKSNKSQISHFQVWIDDVESGWVNGLGLNFDDYIGFGEEKFVKFLTDLAKKILGKKVTISYIEKNKNYYVQFIKLAI